MSVQLCGCGSGDHGAVSVSGSDPGDRSGQGSGRRGGRYLLYVCRSADEDSGEDPGITQEMVAGQPTPAEAVRAFLDFCGELDLMGHNLIFDYSFLKHQAADQKIPFEKNGIDTLKIARTLLPDLESRSLTNLCGYFQIDRAHAHRAYHDALATHELYQHLIRIAGEGQERIFQPKQLQYKVKRRGPITPAQKAYLNDLVKYHKIELDVSVDSLTKNEASRKIDTIIARYGRIKR